MSTASSDPDDIEQLRAERDALAAEVTTLKRGGWARRTLVGIFVVIAWLALTLAPVAIWARNQVLETDRIVTVAGPLAKEAAVQSALATWVTNELVVLVQPEKVLEDALPDRADVLATPLANAVEDFVRGKVLEFFESSEFAELWDKAVAAAHELAIKVLEGNAPNVTAGPESVTINLVPVIQRVLDRITSASPELFGRQIDIPDIDLNDVPKGSAQALGDAVGVDVPDDFGQLTLYDEGRLAAAQDALRLINQAIGILIFLAIAAPIAAIAISRKHLGTASLVLLGWLVGLVLVRRGLFMLMDTILGKVRVPANRGAVERLLDRLVDPLLTATAWMVGGAAVLVIVLYLVSSRSGAVKIRAAIPRVGHQVVEAARANRVVAQVLIVAAGLLVLWQVSLGWLATLVLVAVVAALTLAVGRLPDPDDPTAPADAAT